MSLRYSVWVRAGAFNTVYGNRIVEGFRHTQEDMFDDDDVRLLCVAVGAPSMSKTSLLRQCPISRDATTPEREFALMEDIRVLLRQPRQESVQRSAIPALDNAQTGTVQSSRTLRSQSNASRRESKRSRSVISETTNVNSTFSRAIS